MIIVFNGCAASGKGTIAGRLARVLAIEHYDFGLLYRGLAELARQMGRDAPDASQAKEMSFEKGRIYIRGIDLTDELRSEEAGLRAARLASQHSDKLAQIAKTFVCQDKFVADGRTISTIFPDADWHFELVVDLHTAQKRRVAEAPSCSFVERWRLDESRKTRSPRAIEINTSGNSIEQTFGQVVQHLLRSGMEIPAITIEPAAATTHAHKWGHAR